MLCAHAALGVAFGFPWAYRDEAAYLLNAAALAGFETTYANSYAIAYSALIAPLFASFRSFELIYALILVLNAATAGALFLVLRGLLLELREIPPARATAIAGVCSLFAPIWVLSQLALPEVALALVYSLTLLALARAENRGTASGWIGFAALAGLAPMVHYRAFPVAAAAWVVLAAAYRSKKISRSSLTTSLACSASVLGVGAILKALANRNLRASADGTMEHYADFADSVARAALSWKGALSGLGSFAGQAFYLAAATGCVALLGYRALWRDAFGAGQARGRLTPLFALGSFSGMFLVSVAAKVQPTVQDHLIFGRYNEVVALPLIAFGLAALFRPGENGSWSRARAPLAWLCALGLVASIHQLAHWPALSGSRLRVFDISGVAVALAAYGKVNLPILIGVGASLTVAVFRLSSTRPRGSAAFVAFFFALNSAFGMIESDRYGQARRQHGPRSEIVAWIRQNEEAKRGSGEVRPRKCLRYHVPAGYPWQVANTSVRLFDWEIHWVKEPTEAGTCPGWIIAASPSILPGSEVLAREGSLDLYLLAPPAAGAEAGAGVGGATR